MKLSQYAKKAGISYKTAWRWYKAGTLDAYQTPTGMVVVRDPHMERIGTVSMVLASFCWSEERTTCKGRDFLLVLELYHLFVTL